MNEILLTRILIVLHLLGLFVLCCLFKAFELSGLMCIIISVVVLF
jgi:hypothetical protein